MNILSYYQPLDRSDVWVVRYECAQCLGTGHDEREYDGECVSCGGTGVVETYEWDEDDEEPA